MTGRTRIMAAVLFGAALIGGAAWAEPRMASEVRGAGATAPAEAARPATARQVARLVRVGPLLQVVATEGARHGLGLEQSLFPGKGGKGWAREVARIQSPDRLLAILVAKFERGMRGEDLSAAEAFFASSLGQRITARELEMRRAMLDAEVQAGAISAAATLREERAGRAALIDRLIETLDLVTANVLGGMNANYAFYRGLGDGGALEERLTERDMLSMVRGQESQIRETTSRWLRAYLTMAYAPLSDADIERYIDFSRTPAGRRYMTAMGQAYGAVFERTSYDLGRAAARYMVAEDA
jgi:hypothetical protein